MAPPPVRVANFMDSSLESLETKGVLEEAVRLYNPGGVAERVVHFTPWPADVRFGERFAPARIDLVPYIDPPGTGPRWLRAMRALRTVYRELRERRVNVVRARLPYFGALLGCVCAKLLGARSIVSLGGSNRLAQDLSRDHPFGSRRLARLVESTVLRLADVVLVPNEYTARYVAEVIGARRAGERVQRIPWILPAAPDAASARHVEALGLPSGAPLVLVVGFLNRYKLTDVMYDVARGLAGSGACLVFCGDGPLRAEGEAAFAGASHVRFLGWQPRATVQALIARAAVVLVPMSGFVLLEAAQQGRAVVAADLEWHGELVEDGVTGALVAARAVNAWVERTSALLRDPALRAQLGGALAERFRRDYDPAALLAREMALYRRLAASTVDEDAAAAPVGGAG